MRRWVVVTVVAVVASVALVGVLLVIDNGDESGSTFGGIPVADAAVRTAGTELPNGFTVAKGSALVGDVFPNSVEFLGTYNGVPVPNPGWSANLLVTGDPRRVIAEYRDQATAAGLSMDEARCGPQGEGASSFYSCETRGANLSIWIMRGHAPFGTMSHMMIAYSGDDTTTSIDRSPQRGTVAQISGPSPPPVPTNWESLAQPGDFMYGDSPKAPLNFMAPPFKIEPGSELAAPVGPAGTWGTYDWIAALRVTGDPAQIAQAYQAQLAARPKTFGTVGKVIQSQPAPGTIMYEFGADNLGAWDYRIEVLHGPHGDWMRIRAGAQT